MIFLGCPETPTGSGKECKNCMCVGLQFSVAGVSLILTSLRRSTVWRQAV